MRAAAAILLLSCLLGGGARGDEGLVLVDAGTSPRRLLRLQPASGPEQRFTATVRAGEKGRPTLLGSFAFRARDLNPADEGATDFTLALDDTGVAVEPLVPRGVADDLAAAAQRWLATVEGQGRVSAHGVVSRFEVRAPDGALPWFPAERRDAVRDAARALADLWRLGAAPLPRVPVGVGARWRTERGLAQRGMILRAVGQHQLVRLDGGRAIVEHRTTISATPQSLLATGGLRSVELLRLEGWIRGERTLDLARPLPVAESSRLRLEVQIALVRADGRREELSTLLEVELELR